MGIVSLFRVWSTEYPVPSTQSSIPSSRHSVLGTRYRVLGTTYRLTTTILCLHLLTATATAQTALPIVEEVPFEPLRAHCQRLLEALGKLDAPLPPPVDKELKTLLRNGDKDRAAAEKIQKLLDPRCLIGVSINPESRVKAARGPALAELRLNRPVVVLVKVQNEAGVTHALTVSGPQLRTTGKADGERWLDAAVSDDKPLGKSLAGEKVEYVVLKLTAREAGKREATLRFDVGQGTQDLGFRAEVPVLFTVMRP